MSKGTIPPERVAAFRALWQMERVMRLMRSGQADTALNELSLSHMTLRQSLADIAKARRDQQPEEDG